MPHVAASMQIQPKRIHKTRGKHTQKFFGQQITLRIRQKLSAR